MQNYCTRNKLGPLPFIVIIIITDLHSCCQLLEERKPKKRRSKPVSYIKALCTHGEFLMALKNRSIVITTNRDFLGSTPFYSLWNVLLPLEISNGDWLGMCRSRYKQSE